MQTSNPNSYNTFMRPHSRTGIVYPDKIIEPNIATSSISNSNSNVWLPKSASSYDSHTLQRNPGKLNNHNLVINDTRPANWSQSALASVNFGVNSSAAGHVRLLVYQLVHVSFSKSKFSNPIGDLIRG